VEVAYAAYDAEYRKRVGQDPAKLAELQKVFQQAQAEAQKFVIPNQFSAIAEENGAEASTHRPLKTPRSTSGACHRIAWNSGPILRASASAIPSSAEFLQGAQRRAGGAPDAVSTPRHRPHGRAVPRQRLRLAPVPPARRRLESEISQISATEADAFHVKYYVPSNIVIAVVGDVKAADAMPVLERYFGAHPRRPQARADDDRRAAAGCGEIRHHPRSNAALYIEGYHRPTIAIRTTPSMTPSPISSPTAAPPASIASLVRDQAIAAEAQGFSGFPGDKFPASSPYTPFPPRPLAGRDALGHPQRARSAQERRHHRRGARTLQNPGRADLLRGLANNEGLARQLASSRHASATGDNSSANWRRSTPSAKRMCAASPTRSSSTATEPARGLNSSRRNDKLRERPNLAEPPTPAEQNAGGAK